MSPETPAPAGLRTIGDFLLQDSLRHSVRVLILISLGINRHLSFPELLELTGSSKGSLGHHLDQLAEAGYVESRMVFTLGGPRIQVEITAEGRAVYEQLAGALAQIGRGAGGAGLAPSPATGLSRG